VIVDGRELAEARKPLRAHEDIAGDIRRGDDHLVMPYFLTRLPAVLLQQVSLDLESSDTLCGEVEKSKPYKTPAKGGAVTPKRPAPVPSAARVQLTPIEILQTLGLAMLPSRHTQRHLASWQWSLIRYGYLIDRLSKPGERLVTNSLVGDYRHHHMTALSEAFGVGCALSYAQRWLKTQVPPDAVLRVPIDFDYLVGPRPVPLPGRVKVAPLGKANRRPDCLLVAHHPSRGLRLLVVECKGTSSGRARAVGQLGSAMHQLEGIVFTHSGQPPVSIERHAYAAWVSKRGSAVELYGVDPPEPGEQWVRPEVPDRDKLHRLDSDEHGRVVFTSPAALGGRALRFIEDRMIAWAGAGDGLEEADIKSLRHEESAFGDLVGANSSLTFPDGDMVEVFTGGIVKALNAVLDPDRDRAAATRAEIAQAIRAAESQRLNDNEDPEQVASAINEDGLALRIRVLKGQATRRQGPAARS
jgi:hypothetical protein